MDMSAVLVCQAACLKDNKYVQKKMTNTFVKRPFNFDKIE